MRLPGSGDTVHIDNGEIVDLRSDLSSRTGAFDGLFITGGSELQITDADAFLQTLGDFFVRTGSVRQSSGDVDAGSLLTLGDNAGSGQYRLSGGRLLVGDAATIGSDGGNGSLTVDGTGFADTDKLDVGFGQGSVGAIDVRDQGELFVSGERSTWIGSEGGVGALRISGRGVVTIYEPGDVSVYSGRGLMVGYGEGSRGTVEVRDDGHLSVTAHYMSFGIDGGTGSLHLSGNATVDVGVLDLGGHPLTTPDSGVGSYGELAIEDSAALDIEGWLIVALAEEARGAVTQTGGVVSASFVRIGDSERAVGRYDMSGGELNSGYNLAIGVNGSGSFNISAGVVNIDPYGLLSLGSQHGGSGRIDMSGGVINTGFAALGATTNSEGIVDLSGGDFNVASDLDIGSWNVRGVGELNLMRNAAVNVAGTTHVGGLGTGVVNIDSQDATLTSHELSVRGGTPSSNDATLNLNAGTVTVTGDFGVGQTGSGVGAVHQTGGTLKAGHSVIGEDPLAKGVYNISGGEFSTSGDLQIGVNLAAEGQLNVAGGTVTASSIAVGENPESLGVIRQTGGTVELNRGIVLGTHELARGEYHISRGELRVIGNMSNDGIVVGGNGAGVFTIDGDARVSVNAERGALTVGGSLAEGQVNQSGGRFDVGDGFDIGIFGTGVYNMSGGRFVQTAGEGEWMRGPRIGVGKGGRGTLNLSGGTMTLAGHTIFGLQEGEGKVNQTGGALTIAGHDFGDPLLMIGDCGSLTNSCDGENAYNISEGSLLVPTGSVQVGHSGPQENTMNIQGSAVVLAGRDLQVGGRAHLRSTGEVNQNGGSVTVGNLLDIGQGGRSEGIYNLSGGTLTAGGAIVASYGTGELNISGGEFALNGDLQFAMAEGGVGTVNLSGGLLDMRGRDIVFGQGDAALHVTGGILRDAGQLNFSLVNQGGAVQPGAIVGTTVIGEDYVQTEAGIYDVDITGIGIEDTDLLDVLGTANLDGMLRVSLRNFSFRPSLGDTFDVLTAGGGVVGAFSAAAFPEMDEGLGWQVNYFPHSVQLEIVDGPGCAIAGDTSPCYGQVDVDDLNRVRNHFGSGDGQDRSGIPGDTVPFDGLVSIDDLNAVRNRFGAATTTVPEGGSLALAMCGVAILFLPSRRRRMTTAERSMICTTKPPTPS